jgi:hypothetical protein
MYTYPQINTTNGSNIIQLVNALIMETSRSLLLFAGTILKTSQTKSKYEQIVVTNQSKKKMSIEK